MIVYNVTISLDKSVEKDWTDWMRTTHIPDVLKTECFVECRFMRVHGEEEGGVTYACQYVAKSQDDYNVYQQLFAPKLQYEHATRYQGKSAAFRTELTIIEEFKA